MGSSSCLRAPCKRVAGLPLRSHPWPLWPCGRCRLQTPWLWRWQVRAQGPQRDGMGPPQGRGWGVLGAPLGSGAQGDWVGLGDRWCGHTGFGRSCYRLEYKKRYRCRWRVVSIKELKSRTLSYLGGVLRNSMLNDQYETPKRAKGLLYAHTHQHIHSNLIPEHLLYAIDTRTQE